MGKISIGIDPDVLVDAVVNILKSERLFSRCRGNTLKQKVMKERGRRRKTSENL
jgi:hypothetical protein